MTTIEELQAKARNWFQRQKHAGKQSARLGVLNASGDYELQTDDLKGPAFQKVTIDRGGAISITSARNREVPLIPGAYVELEEDKSGILEIVGYDSARADRHLGSRAPGKVGPHDHTIGSGLEYTHPTRLFQAGRAGVYADGSTMYVWVDEFEHAGGKFPGGVLDLTASIPGAGSARMVLVSLDTLNNALQATNGDLKALPLFDLLTASDAAEIAVNGAVRLAGVRLQAGQTSISNERDFFDQRQFFTESNDATSGVGFPIVVTSALVIPDNRQLVVHDNTIETGGSITLEGTGALFYV